MFPIGDDNQDVRSTPIVTWALIAANVFVFIIELAMGAGLDRFIARWGMLPGEISTGRDLHTLITSMFLHGGFAHIGGNMLFLWVFGDNVEDRLGHVRFLIFYIVTGLAAGLAHVAVGPDSLVPTVGASGAISGVLGAYILMFRSNRVSVVLGFFVTTVPAWAMIGFWAVQQFVATFATIASTDLSRGGGVAYAAHAGGFVAGLVVALVMGGLRRRPERYTRDW